MNLVAIGIVAGVLGTVSMDGLNRLVSSTGLIARIDVRTIGRMAAGWARGRFRYGDPRDMVAVENEVLLGFVTHYTIGIGLATPFVICWGVLLGRPVSPVWALAYGVGTTVASFFLVYPFMGLGVLGRRSPEGLKAPISSLANHLFFGIGMAAGVALLEYWGEW